MLIEFHDVNVSYGAIKALQGVSLSVKEGSIVALIGANGAGKTTLLNSLTGVVRVKSGKIIFCDEEITNMKPYQISKKKIAHVPEGRKIFPRLTVEENLRVGAFILGNNKEEINRNLRRNYELFPILDERKSQLGGTLSGGEQQMLAIARGLMMDPDLLLLDEPSLGIAPIIVEKIFDYIKQINAMGKTILLVEQNANLALETASYVYVLENGRITNENTSEALLKDDSVRKAYIGV